MTPEQEQRAFSYCNHHACMELGLKATKWEDVKKDLILVCAGMGIAWNLPPTQETEDEIKALLERVRVHVYETDIRNVLAYCYQESEKIKGGE